VTQRSFLYSSDFSSLFITFENTNSKDGKGETITGLAEDAEGKRGELFQGKTAC
jgi:hypothetical protein